MQWFVLSRSQPLSKTLTDTYFKAHSRLTTLIQFQTHISPSIFASGGHGVVRPCTSPAPNTTQRLQTCSAYLRQNSIQPKREWTSPPPGNVLSRGQAASSCARRKVFLSGLRNLAGWLGHRHDPAGCASQPWQDGNLSLLLHKCETLFSSFTTTVYPALLYWGAEAHTHLGLYYCTWEDFLLSVIPDLNSTLREIPTKS